jgi:hypothetical protein
VGLLYGAREAAGQVGGAAMRTEGGLLGYVRMLEFIAVYERVWYLYLSVSNIYLCLSVSLSIYLSTYLPIYLYIYICICTQLSAHIDILCVPTIITVCRYLFCSICPGGVIFPWATCRCEPVEGVTVGWPCWLSAAKGLSPRGFGGPCVEFTLRGLVWKLGKGPGSLNWP